jgi:hypothetical protein
VRRTRKFATVSRAKINKLLRLVVRAAKLEAEQEQPYQRGEPAPHQRLVRDAVTGWIDDIAAQAIPAQEAWIQTVRDRADAARKVAVEVVTLQRYTTERLTMGDLYSRLPIIVVLAELVQIAALWELVDHLPLPFAFITAAAIAVVEGGIAVVFGIAVAALVFDVRGSAHEINPWLRRLWLAAAIITGIITLVIAVGLAIMRGLVFVWLPLALAVALIAALWGAALYESRYHRKAESLGRRHGKLISRARGGYVAFRATQEGAMGAGRAAIATGRGVLRKGDVAFEQRWKRVHWSDGTPPPMIPVLTFPGDVELEQRLLIPFPLDLALELGIEVPSASIPPLLPA